MHLIDSLEFDVALASEERAFDEQERLQDFLRGPALQVIRSVFDELSPPHDSWRLDRLEVDLGVVEGNDLTMQWEQRLREALHQQLLRLMQGRQLPGRAGEGAEAAPDRHPGPGAAGAAHAAAVAAAAAAAAAAGAAGAAAAADAASAAESAGTEGAADAGTPDPRRAMRRHTDLPALLHFLHHGTLPWHVVLAPGQRLADWMSAALPGNALALAQHLRESPQQRPMVRRLAQQLPASQLVPLAQALGLPVDWPLAAWVVEATRSTGTGMAPAARHTRTAARVGAASASPARVPQGAGAAPGADESDSRDRRAAGVVAPTLHAPGAPAAVAGSAATAGAAAESARQRRLWECVLMQALRALPVARDASRLRAALVQAADALHLGATSEEVGEAFRLRATQAAALHALGQRALQERAVSVADAAGVPAATGAVERCFGSTDRAWMDPTSQFPSPGSAQNPPPADGSGLSASTVTAPRQSAQQGHVADQMAWLHERADAAAVDTAVRTLLRQDPIALRGWLLDAGSLHEAGRWLARSLSTPTWHRLLSLVAPKAATALRPWLRRRGPGGAWMRLSRRRWSQTSSLLREAALTAVLASISTRTDAAAVLRATFELVAQQFHATDGQVAAVLRAGMDEAVDLPAPWRAELEAIADWQPAAWMPDQSLTVAALLPSHPAVDDVSHGGSSGEGDGDGDGNGDGNGDGDGNGSGNGNGSSIHELASRANRIPAAHRSSSRWDAGAARIRSRPLAGAPEHVLRPGASAADATRETPRPLMDRPAGRRRPTTDALAPDTGTREAAPEAIAPSAPGAPNVEITHRPADAAATAARPPGVSPPPPARALVRALERHDAATAWLAWQACLATDPDGAISLLASVCRQPALREGLSHHLATSRQLAMVARVAPAALPLLRAMIGRRAGRRAGCEGRTRPYTIAARDRPAAVWSLWWATWGVADTEANAIAEFIARRQGPSTTGAQTGERAAAEQQGLAPPSQPLARLAAAVQASAAAGVPGSFNAASQDLRADQGASIPARRSSQPTAAGSWSTSAAAAATDAPGTTGAPALAGAVPAASAPREPAARPAIAASAFQGAQPGPPAAVVPPPPPASPVPWKRSAALAPSELPTPLLAASAGAVAPTSAVQAAAQPTLAVLLRDWLAHRATAAMTSEQRLHWHRACATPGAREWLVASLPPVRLLALAVQLAPGEAAALRAWTTPPWWLMWGPMRWPLGLSAPLSGATAWSLSGWWRLWLARWAMGHPEHAFDRAGALDAWLVHSARACAQPLPDYVAGLVQRLQAMPLTVSASPPLAPNAASAGPPATAAAGTMAFVLQRARALLLITRTRPEAGRPGLAAKIRSTGNAIDPAEIRGSVPEADANSPALPRSNASAVAPQASLPAVGRWRPPPAPDLRPGEGVSVSNAGLVLLAGFAPRLFAMVGLLEGRAFGGEEAAGRAVHLLQWLVDERLDADEHELVLNKLLCGLPTGTPVPRELLLLPNEREAAQQVLQGVIAHWSALGRTSVQGLRESFLQREGRLTRDETAWRLLVAPRAFDMLLDRLPWSYTLMKLPWMPEVLHVEWR